MKKLITALFIVAAYWLTACSVEEPTFEPNATQAHSTGYSPDSTETGGIQVDTTWAGEVIINL